MIIMVMTATPAITGMMTRTITTITTTTKAASASQRGLFLVPEDATESRIPWRSQSRRVEVRPDRG
jgi:hypothetical protein